MRVLVVLCALLLGCTYETNYYGVTDAGCGVTDMAGYRDHFGEWHEEEANLGIFKSSSKLQGSATLLLQPAPVAPAAGQPWPTVMESNARAGAQTLIDLATRDELPHVVTVSMGYVGPLPTFVFDAGFYSPELVAILDIGIGGIAVQAEVDVIDGFQFAVACSRLQIHVVYRIMPGGLATPVPAPVPSIQAGISVSTGVVAHGRQPQRTIGSTGIIAANGFQVFRIPSFAKSARVAALPNNVTPTELFWNVDGLVDASYPVAGFPSADLPVPNGSRAVCHWNTSLIQETSRRLIFELAL